MIIGVKSISLWRGLVGRANHCSMDDVKVKINAAGCVWLSRVTEKIHNTLLSNLRRDYGIKEKRQMWLKMLILTVDICNMKEDG